MGQCVPAGVTFSVLTSGSAVKAVSTQVLGGKEGSVREGPPQQILSISDNHSIQSRNAFHVQQTDELTCFLFITTHQSSSAHAGLKSQNELFWIAVTSDLDLQGTFAESSPQPLALEALPKAEHSHPDVSLKPSTSAGPSSAPSHSFPPVPLKAACSCDRL